MLASLPRLIGAALLTAVLTSCRPQPTVQSANGDVVHHAVHREATSSISLVRDSACAGRRIVNTRFERAAAGGSPNVIVQSTSDVMTRDCAEGESGSVTVLVWPEDSSTAPLVHFTYAGTRGTLAIPDALWSADTFARLYRITQVGCCGSLDTDTYVNLATGKPVLAATSPLLFFDANGTIRYVAILTQGPALPIDSARWTATTIAIVQYGPGNDSAQWVRVEGDSATGFAVASARLSAPTADASGPLLTLGQRRLESGPAASAADTAVSGVRLLATLVPMGDGDPIDVIARIDADRLQLESVRRRRTVALGRR